MTANEITLGASSVGLQVGIGMPKSISYRRPIAATVQVLNASAARRLLPDLCAHEPTTSLSLLGRGERHACLGYHNLFGPTVTIEPGERRDFTGVAAPALRQLFDQAGPGVIRVSVIVTHAQSTRSHKHAHAQSPEFFIEILTPACFAELGLPFGQERTLRHKLRDGKPDVLESLLPLPEAATDEYLAYLLPSEQAEDQVDHGVMGVLLQLGARGEAIVESPHPRPAQHVAQRLLALRKEAPLPEDLALFGALHAAAHDMTRMLAVSFRYHWSTGLASYGFDMHFQKGELHFSQPPPRPGVASRGQSPVTRPARDVIRAFLLCLARSGVWLLPGSRPHLPDEPKITITLNASPDTPGQTVQMPGGQWGKGPTADLATACKDLMAG